ncbi:hypothetical protein GGF37_007494, partial [Kickxella alabastrina]
MSSRLLCQHRAAAFVRMLTRQAVQPHGYNSLYPRALLSTSTVLYKAGREWDYIDGPGPQQQSGKTMQEKLKHQRSVISNNSSGGGKSRDSIHSSSSSSGDGSRGGSTHSPKHTGSSADGGQRDVFFGNDGPADKSSLPQTPLSSPAGVEPISPKM